MRKTTLTLLAFVLATLSWSGTTFGQQPKSGGAFHTYLSGDLQAGGLDPARFTGLNEWAVAMEIYNGLVQFDDRNAIVPDLAERWSVSPDGKVYTFILRKGIRFTNGREVTAQDVKYSLERLMAPATKSPNTWIFDGVITGATEMAKGQARNITGISTPDRYTVEIALEKPLGHFLSLLTMPQAFVLPREEAEKWGADYVSHPMGTGPFTLAEWRRQDRIVLRANPQYFSRRPYLDGVEIRIIPEASTAEAEFRTGRLDVLGIPDATFTQWVTDPRWKPYILKGAEMMINYLGFNLRQKPFDDVRVRRAVAYAIPRRQILSAILNDRGIIAHGPIPPGLPGYNRLVAPLPYDPSKAKALLREAGHANGIETELLLTPTSGNRRLFDVLQASLRGVGITLKPAFRERAAYFAERRAGNFQIARADWWADYLDAEDFLYPLFDSASKPYTGYRNPKVDDVIDRARATIDAEKRVELYQQAETLVIGDMPWVFLWHSVTYSVHQPWVMGEVFSLTPRRAVKIWLNR